jgi:hypothetical protein
MNWSDIPWSPPARTLRQFAGLWIGCFGGLAGWHALQGHPTWAPSLAALAVTVGPLGLMRPRLVRPIFVAWMVVTFPIGWAVSRLALAFLFYGVFTPLGLWFRLSGRDLLGLRHRPERTTYWTLKPAVHDVHRYYRPF